MEPQYFEEQAQRGGDIAERADPFTKKRLLPLAEQRRSGARILPPLRSTPHFRLRRSEMAKRGARCWRLCVVPRSLYDHRLDVGAVALIFLKSTFLKG